MILEEATDYDYEYELELWLIDMEAELLSAGEHEKRLQFCSEALEIIDWEGGNDSYKAAIGESLYALNRQPEGERLFQEWLEDEPHNEYAVSGFCGGLASVGQAEQEADYFGDNRDDCAYTLTEARKALQQFYSLVILDINLPDGNGLELCREIRSRGDTPVIFLTADDTEEDMIEGFQAGCDDYIAKPFSVELFNQRIMAVLRRSDYRNVRDLFHYKDLSVDFGKMQVFCKQAPVKMSATEYKLLELLIKNRGQVLMRESILEKIWDCDGNYVDENTLNVLIRRLRQKIEEDSKNPQYIITVFGIGYTFGE